jgi:hypothetical protein
LTAATLLTRASVGLGPLLGLALVTAGLGVGILAARRGRRWPWLTWLAPGTEDDSRRPSFVGFCVAVVLPLAAYAGVNLAKFSTLFTIPFSGQRFTVVDPGRQAMLRANGGTLFGLQFLPTTIIHYLRPDGIALTKSFPFVDFPALPGPVVGNVLFDLVDRSASLPAVAPFLLVLAAVGAAYAFWPSRWSDSARASLRVPILAATAGAATILPFGFIANRYLGDFVIASCRRHGAENLHQRQLRPHLRRVRPHGVGWNHPLRPAPLDGGGGAARRAATSRRPMSRQTGVTGRGDPGARRLPTSDADGLAHRRREVRSNGARRVR